MTRARWTRWPMSLARLAGCGRNTLRRTSDRIESAVILAAVAVALAVVPAGMAVGRAVYHHNLAISAQQNKAARHVTATLSHDAPGSTAIYVPVQGWWTDRTGRRHVGTIEAIEGLPAGATAPIWTDSAGRLIDPPLSRDEAWASGGLAELITIGDAFALLAAAVAVFRWRINRARAAAWDAEWQHVGPRWSHRPN